MKKIRLDELARELGTTEETLRKIGWNLVIRDYFITETEAAKIRAVHMKRQAKARVKVKANARKKPTARKRFAAVNPTTALRRAGKDDSAHFVQGGLPESKQR